MITWFIEHKEDIVAAYGCLVAFCTAVVKIFPSNKTNSVWGNIVKLLDFFSTVYTDSDKEKLSKAKK
jgi:hypothetical protein